jgi:hypothetical protein
MRTLTIIGLALTITLAGVAHAADIPAPPADPKVGINLAGPADWNTELPFVDVFRMSRAWISQEKDKAWGTGPALSLDKHGWVAKLAPNCWAETPLCTIQGGHYPEGEYTVLYEGTGKFTFSNAEVISEAPGKMIIRPDPERGGFFLRIMETDPSDYIRNIRVIMPGFVGTFGKNPWHPLFLERWSGMACLRFMDFMHTNNSHFRTWSDRPVLEDATFTVKGIALEWMTDLANRLHADAWFCMPHLADDDYIRAFATQVKKELDPNLKIYVEFSNETWNGQFVQTRWAGDEGLKLGFAEKHWEAGWRFTAHRSVQIFKVWEDVFDGTERLVRVLPTQAANPWVSERIVEWQEAYKHADALAIAPYISCNVMADGERLNVSEVEQWSVEEALDYMENTALPESIKWIEGNKNVADKYGLKLITYEGGQHMVGVGNANRSEKLNQLLHTVNAHPRMGTLYTQYHEAWEKAGGDLFAHFSSVGRWSQHGSWGLLQYYDDPPQSSPKYMAVKQWGKKLND